jgi:hypothetical protein
MQLETAPQDKAIQAIQETTIVVLVVEELVVQVDG